MTFTLEELKLANEVCFPDTFRKLLTKHLPEEYRCLVGMWAYDFKNRYDSDLLRYVSQAFGRSNVDILKTFERVIADLLNPSDTPKES